jgi:glutathione S-transferase
MKLYYNPLSSYSQKAMIAFYEKGVAFDPIVVNLMTPEGIAEYASVYPLKKIPMLKVNDDRMVPESSTIIEYLQDEHPQGTQLIPQGVAEARQVRMMDRMCDLYLNDPVVSLLFNRLGFRQLNEADIAKSSGYISHTLEQLDKRLGTQDWLCGDFSMADCAAIPALYYAQMVAPLSDYPNVVRYFERARQRPSYARVMAEFVPIWEGMMAQGEKK